MNQESRATNQKLQSRSRFDEHKAIVKRTAKMYIQYFERALEQINEVISKNNYAAASYAGRQVVMARGL